VVELSAYPPFPNKKSIACKFDGSNFVDEKDHSLLKFEDGSSIPDVDDYFRGWD
jgi:hypothetical protein